MENIDKLDLKEAKELLEDALYFINNVPNRRYFTKNHGADSYKLASQIGKFLKKGETNDTGKE